jgi:hypothetical protein
MIHVIPVLDIITRESIPQWSDYATQEGWEGVMLNAADGYYRKTRSPQLLKVKKMHTADLEIVGFNEATSGKFKGQLQSLNVRLNDNESIQKTATGSYPVMKPDSVNKILTAIGDISQQMAAQNMNYVILTSPKIRLAFRKLIAFNFPDVAVLSLNEIPNEITIESVGNIEI